MERQALTTSSPAPGGANLADGPSFLEILAAQREARRASGEVMGGGATRAFEPSFSVESGTGIGYADGDVSEFDLDEETASDDARTRRMPRGFGQGVVEYALLLVLVALVVTVVLGTVGHQAQDMFSNLSHGLAT